VRTLNEVFVTVNFEALGTTFDVKFLGLSYLGFARKILIKLFFVKDPFSSWPVSALAFSNELCDFGG